MCVEVLRRLFRLGTDLTSFTQCIAMETRSKKIDLGACPTYAMRLLLREERAVCLYPGTDTSTGQRCMFVWTHTPDRFAGMSTALRLSGAAAGATGRQCSIDGNLILDSSMSPHGLRRFSDE